jgi:hypothetical protein|nr:MAG TPA: hypothetical protein [Caudoviricetes sp.]
MSVPARIVDKLRNYEYEKCGYESAIIDIYALIHHIAILEEEIDSLKEHAPRPVEGDGSDLPIDTVVVDKNGDAWQHYEANGWEPIGGCCCMHHTLPDDGTPYIIVYTPEKES